MVTVAPASPTRERSSRQSAEMPAAADVLVAVPDQSLREVLAEALRLDGYRVQTAPDAAQTLVRLLGTSPDLLVLEGTAPFAAEVREWSARRSIRLLLLVPAWDEGPPPEDPGAVVLPMPFDLPQLRRALANVRGATRNRA